GTARESRCARPAGWAGSMRKCCFRVEAAAVQSCKLLHALTPVEPIEHTPEPLPVLGLGLIQAAAREGCGIDVTEEINGRGGGKEILRALQHRGARRPRT